MRLRAVVVAAILAGLAVVSVVPASAATQPRTGAATTVAPAPGGAGSVPASSSSPGLTRAERGLLLVTLTFLVGAGLLGNGQDAEERETAPRRPAITLYDDPALFAPTAPVRRRPGKPPPLR